MNFGNRINQLAGRAVRDTAYYVLFLGTVFSLYMMDRGDVMARQMMPYLPQWPELKPEAVQLMLSGWLAQQIAVSAVTVLVMDFIVRLCWSLLKWAGPNSWTFIRHISRNHFAKTVEASNAMEVTHDR